MGARDKVWPNGEEREVAKHFEDFRIAQLETDLKGIFCVSDHLSLTILLILYNLKLCRQFRFAKTMLKDEHFSLRSLSGYTKKYINGRSVCQHFKLFLKKKVTDANYL